MTFHYWTKLYCTEQLWMCLNHCSLHIFCSHTLKLRNCSSKQALFIYWVLWTVKIRTRDSTFQCESCVSHLPYTAIVRTFESFRICWMRAVTNIFYFSNWRLSWHQCARVRNRNTVDACQQMLFSTCNSKWKHLAEETWVILWLGGFWL